MSMAKSKGQNKGKTKQKSQSVAPSVVDEEDVFEFSASEEEVFSGDENQTWEVSAIVGEEVTVIGESYYEVKWHNWKRSDGSNTTWVRANNRDDDVISKTDLPKKWTEKMGRQGRERAERSLDVNIAAITFSPLHDRLTAEKADAVEYKWERFLKQHGTNEKGNLLPIDLDSDLVPVVADANADVEMGERYDPGAQKVVYISSFPKRHKTAARNKVSQEPRDVSLEIFKTRNNRGWGVRATKKLQKGWVIGIATGKLKFSGEPEERGPDAVELDPEGDAVMQELDDGDVDGYWFNLDWDGSDTLSFSAYRHGNWTRFVNHSCEPNMRYVTVRRGELVNVPGAEGTQEDLTYVAMVTTQDVPQRTELTVDYLQGSRRARKGGEMKGKGKAKGTEILEECRCGAARCRGSVWD
ncbi:hypothetical protein K488DRAFT_88844 [Vararia minispora EC-137]|uniref:Uncharacterized protein n=1 Tax=Vararia minispora EC-137 TaxID=1314806 RepID=A0ACB8QC57_9AGAM|nr:hypothetical protein K488DRAFT_88844 [Vararia minispora EC-137]